MKKLLLAPLLILAALALPGYAAAGPCGLPDSKPLWIDFATPAVERIFGRPGLVLGVSSGDFPAQMRATGAKTVFWDMYLRQRVGTPSAPADPSVVEAQAQHVFDVAVRQSACDTPLIILNELFGAQLETPWSPSNEAYRANVLAFVRSLAARGAHPMLLLSRLPYTSSEQAAQWWRQVSEVADLVQEQYFGARLLWKEGPILANRRMRTAFRNAVGRLTAVGVPVSRIGLVLGFFTKGTAGGREGLVQDVNWYRIVKWQARAARQISAETKIGTVVSWGWAPYSQSARDAPDTAATACVYLWARDPGARFCDGPKAAGPRFNADLTEGQLILPKGARCVVDGDPVSGGAIAALARVTGDPAVAFSIAYARAAESVTPVSAGAVAAAEGRIVKLRFHGNRSRYLSGLHAAGATLKVARAALADELRRQQLAAKMSGKVPRSEILTFYDSYPDLPVRLVQAHPAPWWLGDRTRGLALSGLAPDALFSVPQGKKSVVLGLDGRYTVTPLGEVETLGAVPLEQASHAIGAALSTFARRAAFERWTLARQRGLLAVTTCSRDVMPQPSTIHVADFLPFLSLDSSIG